MPMLTVSPAYHFCPERCHFHSCEGASPGSSPSISMPVRAPKPYCVR